MNRIRPTRGMRNNTKSAAGLRRCLLLGVLLLQASIPVSGQEGHVPEPGIGITRIVVGSGAEAAGLRERDRLLSIDARAVTTRAGLAQVLDELTVGQEVDVEFMRGGKTLLVPLKLGRGRHEDEPSIGVGLIDFAVRGEFPLMPTSHDILHELRFPEPPQLVCRLFNPTHRATQEPGIHLEPLTSSSEESPRVFRIVSSRGGGNMLMLLHHVEADSSEIRYSIVYNEVEIEKLAIDCGEHSEGGTLARVREVIIGLSPYGNLAVDNYVAQGGVVNAIEALDDAIKRHLAAAGSGE